MLSFLFLSQDSDDETTACLDGTNGRKKKTSLWRKFWDSRNKTPKLAAYAKALQEKEEPSPDNSDSDDDSLGFGGHTGEELAGGRRVQHDTLLFPGIPNSPHYKDIDKYYDFPHVSSVRKIADLVIKWCFIERS